MKKAITKLEIKLEELNDEYQDNYQQAMLFPESVEQEIAFQEIIRIGGEIRGLEIAIAILKNNNKTKTEE